MYLSFADAVPSTEEGKMLAFTVSQGVGGFMAGSHLPAMIPDSFVVRNSSDDHPYAGGVIVAGKRFTSNLYLQSGEKTLAVILKKGGTMGAKTSFLICSPRPMFQDQKPAAEQDGGGTLYHWFRIQGDNFGIHSCTIELWSHAKKDYVVQYSSEPHMNKEMMMAGIVAPVSIRKGDQYVAFMKQVKRDNVMAGVTWSVHVAPGMDPCLVICFVAVLAEFHK
jgi:hypothetical protein